LTEVEEEVQMIGKVEVRKGYLRTSGPPLLVEVARQMIQEVDNEEALVFYAPDTLRLLYSAAQDGEWMSVDLSGPPGVRIEAGPWDLDVTPGPYAPFWMWGTLGGRGILHLRVTHSIRSSTEGDRIAVVNGQVGSSGVYRVGYQAIGLARDLVQAWHHGEVHVHIAEDHWILRMCDRLRVVVEARREGNQVSCVWKTWDDLDVLNPDIRQALRIPDPPVVKLAGSPLGDLPLIGRIAKWAASWFSCSAAEQGS